MVTINTSNQNSAVEALNRLGINHREFPFRKGMLYFCTSPNTGLTFDMEYSENGALRIWRYIGVTSTSKAGKRYEYCKSYEFASGMGVEVTDDGDISLFANQTIDENEPDKGNRIGRAVKSYIKLITDPLFLERSIQICS